MAQKPAKMRKKIHYFLFLLLPFFGFTQNLHLSEFAKVSVLNCDTGHESYSLYGHTGIRIQDSIYNLDIVFNYGTFDFSTPNFMLKFIKGDLQYFVSTSNYRDFEYNYQIENRSIYEHELMLTQNQKQELYEKLTKSLYSDERFYTYKFIHRNCTTMVIDKVNETFGEPALQSKKPVIISYREILYPYLENHFFEKLGINIIFGAKVDQPAEKLFLPLELIKVLDTKTTKVQPKKILFEASDDHYKPSIFNSIYTIIILLSLIVLVNSRKIKIYYFIATGLLGLFFCFVGLYSLHEEILWNYNALLFNPLFIVLAYFVAKNNQPKIVLWVKIIAALHLLYLIYMLNKIHLGIVSPFIIAHFMLLYQLVKRDN